MKIKMLSIYLFTVLFSSNVFAADSINVSQKVYKLFHKSFPEVKYVSWYKSSNTYEAYFKNSDETVCKIYYSMGGELISTIKYYSGNELPLFIRTRLAKKYAGKNVCNVTEIYADNKTVYYITLEDNRECYKVHSSINGDISLDEILLKAS
jgi:hypothetical protein